jgi:hypothetical protein
MVATIFVRIIGCPLTSGSSGEIIRAPQVSCHGLRSAQPRKELDELGKNGVFLCKSVHSSNVGLALTSEIMEVQIAELIARHGVEFFVAVIYQMQI